MSSLILDGLDKIFKDEDAPPIHMLAIFVLFVISAIALYPDLLMTMNSFDYSDYRMYHDITNSISSAMLFLVSIYVTGYNIVVINRTLRGENTILPEIDVLPYKVFINFLPLQFFWFILYAIAYLAVAALVFFTLKTQLIYASIPVALAFILIMPFTSFILAAYARNFDKKGLFDIRILFRFINKKAAKKLLVLILQFAPIWIIVTIFTVLTYQFNIPVKTQVNVTMVEEHFYQKLFVMNAISAYMEIVATFLWSYCIARVFVETEEA
jgi:hypothetical protein